MDGAQNSNTNSRFLINASFFNIRNISLDILFTKEWMKAISASSARIYVSADNVALFSKRKVWTHANMLMDIRLLIILRFVLYHSAQI